MSDLQNSCPRLDPSRLLQMLQSEDVHQQYEALLVACPCRNRYYDKEIWRAVCIIRWTSPDAKARDRANHVLGTLQERTRFDLRSVQMLRWLAEQGYPVFIPVWLQKEVRERKACTTGLRLPKVTLHDVPSLIEALASEDAYEQEKALQVLCPGRTRQYHKKVWLAFFHACHGADRALGVQALQATRRLLEHAKGDPYAQETLQRLHHELCEPACDEPSDVTDALLGMLERPLRRPANMGSRRREDPALRGAAFVEIEPLIAAVHAVQNLRELRKSLHALGRTGDPRALALIADHLDHLERSIANLARSIVLPEAKDAGTASSKDYRPRKRRNS